MSRFPSRLRFGAVAGALILLAAGCSNANSNKASADSVGAPVPGAPSWCGSKKISLGLTDGFGGNS